MVQGAHGRRGATLVEALVAAAVLTLVLAGAWAVLTTGRKGGHQAVRYGSILQAASTMRARLEQDLAAAWVPPGTRAIHRAFRVAPDGGSVVFLRSGTLEDPEAPGPPTLPRRWVRWSSDPGVGGTRVIRREVADGPAVSWESAPATDLRFELIRQGARHYLIAEAMLIDADSAATPSNRRPIPLRVARRLRSPGRLPDGMLAFPSDLLGAPPAAVGAPASLLGGPVTLEVGG